MVSERGNYMEIQWFSKNLDGVATIYETNITLNTVAAENFKNAYSTLIGFNQKENILLIKSLNKEEAVNNYSENDLHPIAIKPSYGRISGKSLIRNICQVFPLDFSKKSSFKFRSEWDQANKYLKIYLKEELSQ